MSSIFHHQGLLVSDVQRAGEFYVEALAGRWLVKPVPLQGSAAAQAIGTDGVRLRVALIGFGACALELFQFVGDRVPEWARLPAVARIPHLGLQVQDTDAALARMVAAGGRSLWSRVDRFGGARVVYAADPDGNVIELLDRSAAYVTSMFHRAYPESDPAAEADVA